MEFRISVEDRGEVYRGIHIQIPRAMYDERLQSAVARASRQARIKGFRPGRVPPKMIAKMYAPELRAEVMDELVHQALERAYEEHKLSVVGVSSLEVEPEVGDADLQVKAQVAIFPEPEIRKFRGLEVKVIRPQIDDEVVERYIAELQESRAKFEPRGEGEEVRPRDAVVVDWSADVEGEDAPRTKEGDLYVLGGRRGKDTAPEISRALAGNKAGDTLEVEAAHPAEYSQHPDLAGKNVRYRMTVKAVYEIAVPELDEEFLREIAKVDSLEEFRRRVREDLEKEAERRFEVAREEKLFEKLIAENAFAVPQELIDHEIRNLLFEMGVLKREDRRAYQIDVSRFRERLGPRAEFRVRSGIILGRIREQEHVSVADADREAWIQKTCDRDKIDDREGFSRAVRAGDRERWFEDVVLREKVVSLLLDGSRVVEEKKPLDV